MVFINGNVKTLYGGYHSTYQRWLSTSQVSEQILSLRLLLNYQAQCQKEVDERTIDTHNLIVDASVKAHQIMEKCLHDILIREGWDLQTLEMPEHLRELIVKKLLGW